MCDLSATAGLYGEERGLQHLPTGQGHRDQEMESPENLCRWKTHLVAEQRSLCLILSSSKCITSCDKRTQQMGLS